MQTNGMLICFGWQEKGIVGGKMEGLVAKMMGCWQQGLVSGKKEGIVPKMKVYLFEE